LTNAAQSAWALERPFREQARKLFSRGRARVLAEPQAGPKPLFRPLDFCRPAGHCARHSDTAKPDAVALHRKRFVGPLIEMTPSGAVAVLRASGGRGSPSAAARSAPVPRLRAAEHQMPMVGHQAIRQQAHAGYEFEGLREDAHERRVVRVIIENAASIVAAV